MRWNIIKQKEISQTCAKRYRARWMKAHMPTEFNQFEWTNLSQILYVQYCTWSFTVKIVGKLWTRKVHIYQIPINILPTSSFPCFNLFPNCETWFFISSNSVFFSSSSLVSCDILFAESSVISVFATFSLINCCSLEISWEATSS